MAILGAAPWIQIRNELYKGSFTELHRIHQLSIKCQVFMFMDPNCTLLTELAVQWLEMPLWKTGLAHGDRVTALDLEPMDETRKSGQGNLKCESLSILCFVRFHLHLAYCNGTELAKIILYIIR